MTDVSPSRSILAQDKARTTPQIAAVILCPGQGAQALGMGKEWFDQSAAARAIFDEADAVLSRAAGDSASGLFAQASLSEICFNGPSEALNRTDVSQPAIFACSVASWRGMVESGGEMPIAATAGLSLGEYTSLYLAKVFDFATGLRLVARRGLLMQKAAENSRGSMVALIGADEAQAQAVCDRALGSGGAGSVLVCANFNAPGQIVLSGTLDACENAIAVASEMGLRATPLTVAGAFHSPLMQPAADQMAESLAQVTLSPPSVIVYSNVTAEPHPTGEATVELLKQRLIEQIVNPVKWAQTCANLISSEACGPDRPYHELAPGSVLRGLMRRIDRQVKVTHHDEPSE